MADITPKEFLHNNPLQLLVHNAFVVQMEAVLLTVARDHAITWEKTDEGDCTGIHIICNSTNFAFGYYMVGIRIKEHFKNMEFGIFANDFDKKKALDAQKKKEDGGR